MTETSTVICDTCGRDLTYTNNSVDYRVVVGNEGLRSRGGVVTDMMIYPPLDRTHHFCNLRCLRESVLVTADSETLRV